jgi:hypothetical protein
LGVEGGRRGEEYEEEGIGEERIGERGGNE